MQQKTIEFEGQAQAWLKLISPEGRTLTVGAPKVEIDGHLVTLALGNLRVEEGPANSQGVVCHQFSGAVLTKPGLLADIEVLSHPASPVLRYRFRLKAADGNVFRLTKTTGQDNLEYGSWPIPRDWEATEVRFSEFDEHVHTYRLSEREVNRGSAVPCMGPLMAVESLDRGQTVLVAYEHGSQTPDAFLEFHWQGERLSLRAKKGNYPEGRVISAAQEFESVVVQLGWLDGSLAQMKPQYRQFLLKYQSPNPETRQPYLFYNTWNFQERNFHWNKQKYLDSMNQDRILAEIEVAHRMGIDVFVLDTGWYEKTGDWEVNKRFFPDGLAEVRSRLSRYGMKLGLWFNPTAAALTSSLAQGDQKTRKSWNGKSGTSMIWETEESQFHCLVSDYWERFADKLIALNQELGVSYFKWDAIDQYGCNDPHHHHGTLENSPQERAESYSFELPRYLCKIIDKVLEACPSAIIDFDVTEDKRAVGLGFLASGKFFLMNNGPYYTSFDDKRLPGGGMGSNVFTLPGNARPRVCRAPLSFDTWIPSVLFLTHYLPDAPRFSQITNLASLFLGQNGIWGDLLCLSEEDIAFFGEQTTLKKKVRHDVTEAFPVRTGFVGGSPEVVEKINPATGKGIVSLFTSMEAPCTYETSCAVATPWNAMGPVEVEHLDDGRARLTYTPHENQSVPKVWGRVSADSAYVLFGVV